MIHGCHFFAPRFRDAGHGAIINTASAAGFAAAPEMTTYNVIKSAVLSLSETLSDECTGSGVHVSALCPTIVPTNIINESRFPAERKSFAAKATENWAFTDSGEVARMTLDACDRNQLYVLPHWDGRLLWRFKRAMPPCPGVGVPARGRLKEGRSMASVSAVAAKAPFRALLRRDFSSDEAAVSHFRRVLDLPFPALVPRGLSIDRISIAGVPASG